MSCKSNLAQVSLTAGTLFLLMSSAAWAGMVNLPAVHIKTPAVKVNPSVPKTGSGVGVNNPTTIGAGTSGAGAGKIKFNEFTIKKTTDSASPKLFKDATTPVNPRTGLRYR